MARWIWADGAPWCHLPSQTTAGWFLKCRLEGNVACPADSSRVPRVLEPRWNLGQAKSRHPNIAYEETIGRYVPKRRLDKLPRDKQDSK